jgi:hypothetical protein
MEPWQNDPVIALGLPARRRAYAAHAASKVVLWAAVLALLAFGAYYAAASHRILDAGSDGRTSSRIVLTTAAAIAPGQVVSSLRDGRATTAPYVAVAEVLSLTTTNPTGLSLTTPPAFNEDGEQLTWFRLVPTASYTGMQLSYFTTSAAVATRSQIIPILSTNSTMTELQPVNIVASSGGATPAALVFVEAPRSLILCARLDGTFACNTVYNASVSDAALFATMGTQRAFVLPLGSATVAAVFPCGGSCCARVIDTTTFATGPLHDLRHFGLQSCPTAATAYESSHVILATPAAVVILNASLPLKTLSALHRFALRTPANAALTEPPVAIATIPSFVARLAGAIVAVPVGAAVLATTLRFDSVSQTFAVESTMRLVPRGVVDSTWRVTAVSAAYRAASQDVLIVIKDTYGSAHAGLIDVSSGYGASDLAVVRALSGYDILRCTAWARAAVNCVVRPEDDLTATGVVSLSWRGGWRVVGVAADGASAGAAVAVVIAGRSDMHANLRLGVTYCLDSTGGLNPCLGREETSLVIGEGRSPTELDIVL